MARKKPAKKARKKTAAKAAGRKSARKVTKKAARKPVKRSAKKAARKAKPKRKAVARKPKKAAAKAAPKAAARSAAGASKTPNLDRPRKTVADIHGLPSSLDMGRSASSAKSGRAEMQERLHQNTSASPALTAGDVDADWASAEAVGDEAPGGDNPTPDQDVVDEIGRALGVEYEDDEELQGGAEITDRDKHRWELDPSSKDDFDEES
jgi:hypothetical protein